jgi:hypothetical protein
VVVRFSSRVQQGEHAMKVSVIAATFVLGLGLAAGSVGTASAQSDRTLGISCTVAGHVHCGEYGSRYRGGWHRGFRAFGAAHCRVVVRHIYRHGREVTVRNRRCW